MSKIKQIPLPLKKTKNRFILSLNRDLYRDDIVQKAILEDQDWISETAHPNHSYVCLELKTSNREDVLDWVNYLTYLHKI